MDEENISQSVDKSQLDFELGFIIDPDIRGLVKKILDNIPDYFWDPNMGSSSSGKYHQQLVGDEKPESLVIHTRRVFFVLMCFLRNPIFEKSIPEKDRDLMKGAALLHDSCKRGLDLTNIDHTVFNHPELVLELGKTVLTEEEFNSEYFQKMCKFIAKHSGPWNSDKRKQFADLEVPETVQELIVHLSDYIASRRGICIPVELLDYERL